MNANKIIALLALVVAFAVAGCGGIDGKIEANCDAQGELEKVLGGEPIGDKPYTKESCVREAKAAQKQHEKSGRMDEFETDLDDATKRFKELKERCEDVDPGEC